MATAAATAAAAAAADEPPYELIYWPRIPGRAELVRLLFEEAGAAYVDTAKSGAGATPLALRYMGHGPGPESADDVNPASPPVFAPPFLKHGALVISQTPNILLYLAPRLGLAPADGPGVFHLHGIALTILDGLVSEPHETHHPVEMRKYYEDQKPEARRRAAAFIEERLPKYLKWAQRLLDARTSGEGPWLYGGRLTYVDLLLFQGIDGTRHAFPKAMAALEQTGRYDGVFALYAAVKARPNVKRYLESERRAPYADGVWRYYAELDQ